MIPIHLLIGTYQGLSDMAKERRAAATPAWATLVEARRIVEGDLRESEAELRAFMEADPATTFEELLEEVLDADDGF